MRIGRVVAIGMVGLAASGCLGGSPHEGGPPRGSGGIGQPARSPDNARPVCPGKATSTVVRVARVSPAWWSVVARRHLTRWPAGGDYRNPEAACRALADFLGPWTPSSRCRCPLTTQPGYTIVGRYQDRPVHLRFDSCSLCGVSKNLRDDFRILFTP